MDTNSRTNKSFKSLISFADEVLVICPYCNARATVSLEPGEVASIFSTSAKAKFRCNSCYRSIAKNRWFGPLIFSPLNARCGHCGSPLKFGRILKVYKDKIKAKCQSCNQDKKYDFVCTRTYANAKQATDPYYGLQLWLQTPIDDNILWAYNFEHLEYLKSYVGAKLREAPAGGKYSLVWKLPDFIKLAKNRDKILKGINKLAKKTA